MNSLIDDLTGDALPTPLNAAGIPAPAATHEDAGLPAVKAAADKTPVTSASFAGLVMTYFINGNSAQWPCDSEPPKDAATLIAIRAALFGTPTFNRMVDLKVVQHLQSVTGAVLHAIQQGLPMIHNARLVSDRERHTGRAAKRLDLVTKLDSLLSSGELETAPLAILPSVPPLHRRAMEYTGVINILPALMFIGRKLMANYAKTFYDQWEKINWQDRRDEIRLELSNTGALTPERLNELQAELSRLESSSAEILAHAASVKVSEAYGPVKQCLLNYLENLAEVLEARKADSVESERRFFEIFGLPREETSVSRQFGVAAKGVRDGLARLKNEQGHVSIAHPMNPATVTGIFGVEIIPGLL